ncbi:MAG: P1 family peptidase [Alphaproteobacteria bacterium]
MRPGPTNGLCDVAGIRLGHAHDAAVRTGVTVLLPDRPVLAAVDVRGGGPGTRESDALDPVATVDRIDALVLAGGSVYGLDAASAVTAALGARGRGFMHRGACVPIVPAAICFDLHNGGDKAWGETPPYARLGRAALENVGETAAVGSVGAGHGAHAGPLQGGLGMASLATEGLVVAALAVVNAAGSVTMPGLPQFWAWPFERGNEFGGLGPPAAMPGTDLDLPRPAERENTTLVVVATDARLTKAAAKRVAVMAQDGLARAIRPVHTPFDGDMVFTLATAARAEPASVAETARIGAMAADCVARAVARGVYAAVSNGPWPSYRDRHPG